MIHSTIDEQVASDSNPVQLAKNWEESAAHFHEGMKYYRDLLIQIGEIIGEQAYISDDGSRQQDVLCAKLPELIKKIFEDAENLLGFNIANISDIESVNDIPAVSEFINKMMRHL